MSRLNLWASKDSYVAKIPSSTGKSRLRLEKIGVKLTTLILEQAAYLGVPVEGPHKPDQPLSLLSASLFQTPLRQI